MLRQIPLTCGGHARPVVNLCFSDLTDGQYYMLSASKDGQPMLRQGETGDWLGTFIGHKGAVWSCALNSNGTKAATGSADFTAKIWDAITGDELHTFSHNYIVRAIDLSKDGQRLILASKQFCYIYDLNKLDAEPFKWETGSCNIKRCAFLDQDCTSVVTASEDNKLKLWDLRNGATTCFEIDLDCGAFGDFSIDKQTSGPEACVLTVACGRSVKFYDKTFRLLKALDAPTPLYSAALAPDGASYVCGGEDFKIYRFRYTDGTEIESFKGHFGPVHCVRFSPDGALYASGSEDGTIRLWQTHLGKDYGLWKVDRSVPMSLPVDTLAGQFSIEDKPHVVTPTSQGDQSNVPIIVVPKSPTKKV